MRRTNMMSRKMRIFCRIFLGVIVCFLSFTATFYSSIREMRRNHEQALAQGTVLPAVTAGTDQSGDEVLPEEQQTRYCFRTEALLNDHYEKHGMDMGFASAYEYELAASAVVNNPNALHKTDMVDGYEMYFVTGTNEYVEVSTDGYIREYFIPEDGLEFYDRQ